MHKSYFKNKALTHKIISMEIHSLMNRVLGDDITVTYHLTIASSFKTAPSKKTLQINMMKRVGEQEKFTQILIKLFP